MDNPWANAWGDPDKPANPSAVASLWTSPSNDDQEADISQPSWSTGADVQWAEPSDAHVSLWNADLPSRDWPSSTYDDLKIGSASPTEQVKPEASSPPSFGLDRSSPSPRSASPSSSPPVPPNVAFEEIDSSPTSPKPISPRPDSPDAFGTFEIGVREEVTTEDPWSPSRASIASPEVVSSPAWGTPWVSDHAQSSEEEKEPDEWELAKKEKERQNRHVPPEVLSDILAEVSQLSGTLWPVEGSGDEKSPSYLVDRTVDIEDLQDFSSARERLIPRGLSLSQTELFSKTFIAKRQAETVRLTRHAPITQSSPMALFLATKGSTAWEVSVKSQPEINPDAALPPGWKITEQEERTAISPLDNKKRGGSKILSFFNRRTPTSTSESQAPEQPASPLPSISRSSSSVVQQSPRLTDPKPPSSSYDPHASQAATKPQVIPAEETSTALPDSSNTTPPPSAVSRFLNRFSRSTPHNDPERGLQNSLALSTDDLEFLSDIVPHTSESDQAIQIQGLTNMIDSSPLPTKLPLPLPPPPRANSHSQRFKPPQLSSTNPDLNNDPYSWFDAPAAEPVVELPASSVPFASSKPSPSSSGFPLQIRQESNLFNIRSSTPIEKSLPPIASSMRSKATTMPTKRIFTAIMSSSQMAAPTRIPKLDASFDVSPPLLSGPLYQSTPPSGIPHVMPPPATSIATTQNLFDDDDFSDFHQSTPNPALPPSATFSSLTSSTSGGSELGLMGNLNSAGNVKDPTFDDFDDFISSHIPGPSPPLPPTKPSQNATSVVKQTTSSTKPSSPPKRKLSRVADHSRTLSLLETAAARKGQWPAPPSPLPEALPPPVEKRESLDLFDTPSAPPINTYRRGNGFSGLGTIAPPPISHASNDYGVPLKSSSPSLSAKPLRPFSPPIQSKPSTPPRPPSMQPTNGSDVVVTTTARTGLSAQDLSFFEGL